MTKTILLFSTLFLVSSALGIYLYLTRPYYPTIHQYILETKKALYVAPGRYKIARHNAVCGDRPTVLDSEFDSWGGAYPGFIIMNPKANKMLPPTVKLYIYYHECGHQFTGVNESKADNYAILHGIQSGWIKNKGDMEEICRFVSKIPADEIHPKGTVRCQAMTQYYQKKTRGKPSP